MSPLLKQVLQEIEQLTTEEQLEVISHATEQLKRRTIPPKKRKLSEFRGIAPNLLMEIPTRKPFRMPKRCWNC